MNTQRTEEGLTPRMDSDHASNIRTQHNNMTNEINGGQHTTDDITAPKEQPKDELQHQNKRQQTST